MKEILGEKLEQAFKELNIDAKKTFQSKIKKNGSNQVWELSDEAYEKICNVKDDDWKNSWSWWRHSEGSNIEGNPTCHMKINGKDILTYYDEEQVNMFVEDFLEDTYISEFDSKDEARKQLVKDYFKEECVYDNFTNYCSEHWGAGLEGNVCAIAVSIAELNHMTLSELFRKYQG